MKTKKVPYELLIRWANGELSGAQISWLFLTEDGGKVVATAIDGPHAIEDENGDGTFLDEVMSIAQKDAVRVAAAKGKACDVAEFELQQTREALQRVEADNAKLREEVLIAMRDAETKAAQSVSRAVTDAIMQERENVAKASREQSSGRSA